ncbi:transposase [Leptospira ainazelensis]|uniref:transposase n=1 Tax=Leptospira ainazelensis TaxID=2810034 RepID=UPI001E40FC33|nr:transposase [Leptospira ainazelensis]
MAKKPFVCADSAVLYSASQRANKGRARYRKTGLTASIYLSEKLGGKQVGTLLHSIAIKNGPAFFTSVSNTKADTIGPLLVKQLPFSTPLFTDEGYPWLFGVYKNHRSVNHSAKSKDNRYKFAKNRWCKDGVHNQVAEGNHRLVKAAFSAYGYIRPQFSQLYLDEFSFLKNANLLGFEDLPINFLRKNDVRSLGSDPVRIGGKGYAHKKGSSTSKNWLSQQIESKLFVSLQNDKSLTKSELSNKSLLNGVETISKSPKGLAKELRKYNSFWENRSISTQAKNRELKYQRIAFKVWDQIHSKEANAHYTVQGLSKELKLSKVTLLKIFRKWIKYRFILRRRIYNPQINQFRIDFQIIPNRKDLLYVLYSKSRNQKYELKFEKNGKVLNGKKV